MILIIDSFFTGSHRYWGEQLKKRLPFNVQLLTLSGKHWKWRMEGGAYELAKKFKNLSQKPKIIIATDMVNIPLFYAFANISRDDIPCILYFHENQFAYPINNLYTGKTNTRDNHFSFINLSSALFANNLVFNSEFNRTSFLDGSAELINQLPKNTLNKNIYNLESCVIYPGIEKPAPFKKINSVPTLLWNHRWEHDKNPELFIEGLEFLKKKLISFKLIILGKGTEKREVKSFFRNNFSNELLHCGFVETRKDYTNLISEATHIPVTSKHDFFGLSLAEAMSYGCFAILPNHQAYPEHLVENELSGVVYNFPNGYFDTLERSISNESQPNVNEGFFFEQVINKWIELLNSKL
tara:strand:+ start:799 stop:1857 length:1059 start_codon:yes stop_codon:yes gene_type:complete